MADITTAQFIPAYEDMVKAGMHFGRKKTIYHPNMKPFIFTSREDIYILDLTKTGEAVATLIDAMKALVAEGKMILFVGITAQSGEAAKSVAETFNMPYVTDRWLGGTLTNFKVINGRVKYLEELEREQQTGGFDKLTKKEKLLKEREITNMRFKYDGLRRLTRLPDMVFVTSLKESMLVIREAKNIGIKTAGVVNTDSDPKLLDFPIPANDNSRKSVEMILAAIKEGLASVVPTTKTL